MNWKWKLAIIVGVLLVIAALIFIIKYQRNIIERQQQMEQSVVEMKRLSNDIVRSQSKYATKGDIQALAKETGIALGPIKEDTKKLGAKIDGIMVVLARTPGSKQTNIGSTTTIPKPGETTPGPTVTCPEGTEVECPNPDKYNYLKTTQKLELTEPFSNKVSIPWGNVSFSAWREKPWDLEIYPRKYSVVSVIARNKEGRLFVYNKFYIESLGEKFPVEIADSKLLEEYPTSSFNLNMRPYLGLDVGTHLNPVRWELTPNLQVSFFSYGKTLTEPEWTFLGLGLGYETQSDVIGFVVSPVSYNVAKHLPLVENVYVGPTIGVTTSGDFSVLGGLRVGL